MPPKLGAFWRTDPPTVSPPLVRGGRGRGLHLDGYALWSKASNGRTKELIERLTDAVAHAKGAKSDVQTHTVEGPDVRAIRHKLHMSRQEFPATYRIPLPTMKSWEHERRNPDAPDAAYLQSIAKRPHEISAAMASEPTEPMAGRRGGRVGLNSVSVPIDGFPANYLHRCPTTAANITQPQALHPPARAV
jgi:putative transcriptional regulator